MKQVDPFLLDASD